MRPELKWLCVGALLGALLIRGAEAQVVRPVDPSRRADLSNKMVDLPAVNLRSVSKPSISMGISELSGKSADQDRLIETPIIRTELRESPIIPTKILPRTNFAAKRAKLEEKLPAVSTVPTGEAPITKRTFQPFTPIGEEEFKQQLNTPH